MIFNKKATFDWMIVGLGNPGLQYEKTRHNAGFMALDDMTKKYDLAFNKNKSNTLYGECKIDDNRVLFAKPQTYMNNSGSSVSAIADFYKIPTDRIIILYDDISLDVGKIRIRRKGSAGGHNGIKDIIELLGTEEITRIKIGVGERENHQYDLKDWVMGKIPEDKKDDFNNALDIACKAIEEIIKRGIDSAMNKYNS